MSLPASLVVVVVERTWDSLGVIALVVLEWHAAPKFNVRRQTHVFRKLCTDLGTNRLIDVMQSLIGMWRAARRDDQEQVDDLESEEEECGSKADHVTAAQMLVDVDEYGRLNNLFRSYTVS